MEVGHKQQAKAFFVWDDDNEAGLCLSNAQHTTGKLDSETRLQRWSIIEKVYGLMDTIIQGLKSAFGEGLKRFGMCSRDLLTAYVREGSEERKTLVGDP